MKGRKQSIFRMFEKGRRGHLRQKFMHKIDYVNGYLSPAPIRQSPAGQLSCPRPSLRDPQVAGFQDMGDAAGPTGRNPFGAVSSNQRTLRRMLCGRSTYSVRNRSSWWSNERSTITRLGGNSGAIDYLPVFVAMPNLPLSAGQDTLIVVTTILTQGKSIEVHRFNLRFFSSVMITEG